MTAEPLPQLPDEQALSWAILALNTIQEPDATDSRTWEQLYEYADAAITALTLMRERLPEPEPEPYPPEVAERLTRAMNGDDLPAHRCEVTHGPGGARCERMAGHEGNHAAGRTVWLVAVFPPPQRPVNGDD